MKKTIIAITMAAAMTAAFAGCNPDADKPTPTEVATTENAEAIATEKTESAATETAESTAEVVSPTEETKYAVLDFNECAEEVLRLTPCKDKSEKLPEEGADDMVLYIQADGTQFGPAWFATDGERFAICNRMCTVLKVYNSDGLALNKKIGYARGDDWACMNGDYIYTSAAKINANTGEVGDDLIESDKISWFEVRTWGEQGSNPRFCVELKSEPDDTENPVYNFRFVELDENNCWQDVGEAYSVKADADSSESVVTLPNGAELTLSDSDAYLIGVDSDGNYYFGDRSIVKVDTNGNIVSQVDIPNIIYEDLWEPHYHYNLLPDGTVYVAAAMNDAYVIWKINM
ncbi:MAG: hypothetical protein IKX58_02630 [Clostridia bacterium]|nr:hypothetical protein [Clostridia bacterium]